MIRWLVIAGWFIAGCLAGAVLLAFAETWSSLWIDTKIPILDLAQLAATVALALYIPLALENYRDKERSARTLLSDGVAEFMSVVRSINGVVTQCTHSKTTTPQDVMKIRTGFITANLKLGRLEQRIIGECPKRCAAPLAAFKNGYDAFWRAVTGGALYGGTPVDWNMWRRQELAFASLEHSSLDLLRNA